jgi:hypothetical protein
MTGRVFNLKILYLSHTFIHFKEFVVQEIYNYINAASYLVAKRYTIPY